MLDSWHSYEYMLDIPNNKYSFWIDGVAQFTNLTYVSKNGYTFSNNITYNGQHAFGWFLFSLFDSLAHSYDLEYYLDDIVIADTYIGPTK